MNLITSLYYELKLHFRSLLFWVGLVLVVVMVYSEVLGPLRSLNYMVEMAEKYPHQFGGSSQRYVDIATNGLSPGFYQDMAGTLADRLQIIISLVAVFIVGFLFHREDTSKNREVVYAASLGSWRYILHKYLGAILALLVMVVMAVILTLVQFSLTSAQLGGNYSLTMVTRPLALLLLPTLAYVTALILFAAAVLDRPIMLVPLYFLYFYATFRPVGTGEATSYPLNLSTFIIRWDGHHLNLFGNEYGLLMTNRYLYLGLSVVLLTAAVLAYQARRRSYQGRLSM